MMVPRNIVERLTRNKRVSHLQLWARRILLACGLAALAGWVMAPTPRLFLIGDSTMADKPLVGSPERGWGQVFPLLLDAQIEVQNHARNGRSTKSFLSEGLWDVALASLRGGDYVMIQFGHNDAKANDTSRYADAQTDFRANLTRFVRDTRSKGANPILITPVVRRRFDARGDFFDVHGDYPQVVREVGQQEGAPVLDLHRRSLELLELLGVRTSEALFLHFGPGEFSGFPQGKQDDTHFSWHGAAEIARLVAAEAAQLPIGVWIDSTRAPSFPGEGKTVLLDLYYNNEWKQDPAGRPVRFHYTWDDTANSGFSILASSIARMGADLDTLAVLPDAKELEWASIYIIVDPDTPRESEQPHFIDTAAANTIEGWVRRGGVLLLLANDSGNAELDHLNAFSERFGIRFNADSRNRVQGRAYETGTFDSLPWHPIFDGVRKIFLKEICTLELVDPARGLLTEGGDIIMATASVGRGMVVAVGDPWLYNEYMDSRRLPEGYDNQRAGENLFRWLLGSARRLHPPEIQRELEVQPQ